jgi:hypothetical protein
VDPVGEKGVLPASHQRPHQPARIPPLKLALNEKPSPSRIVRLLMLTGQRRQEVAAMTCIDTSKKYRCSQLAG